jgi:hypothetical protein
MGKMRIGYGSEFHLLRMLGRHRTQFDTRLLDELKTDGVRSAEWIEWLDAPFNPEDMTKDGELKSMDFLPERGGAAWKDFWPDRKPGKENRDGVPSWDAVGRLHLDGQSEWLLVEAKAHEAEFASTRSKCGAGGPSLEKITERLRETYQHCGGDSERWPSVEQVWLGRGYQIANRMACLRFLLDNNEPARLVYVYFIGDTYKVCPSTPSRWRKVVSDFHTKMGLPEHHALSSRIHCIYPHVAKK